MIQIEIDRVNGDYGFEGRDEAGNVVQMDSSLENGGTNFGARPMQLLLMGLGSCSGIDIIAILKKQRQEIDLFKMKIMGEREESKTPSLWKTIHITFELKGAVDADKAKRACELSIEKYCSVAETLRRAGARITWEAKVNS